MCRDMETFDINDQSLQANTNNCIDTLIIIHNNTLSTNSYFALDICPCRYATTVQTSIVSIVYCLISVKMRISHRENAVPILERCVSLRLAWRRAWRRCLQIQGDDWHEWCGVFGDATAVSRLLTNIDDTLAELEALVYMGGLINHAATNTACQSTRGRVWYP